jgi:prephenate dehydrogenase
MDQTPITILNRIPQIAIVGVGLLGGSIGLALKQAGYTGRRLGVGRRASSLEQALACGCVDEVAVTSPKLWAFDQSTLVILASPIGSFEAMFREIATARASQDKPAGLIVTDAGSTKEMVCSWASHTLPEPGWFVGSHPMAGSEKQGPEHAQADLFHDRPCIITPQADTQSQALQAVEAFWQTLGMTLVRMSPQEHDQVVAAVSHLPHALAVLLVLTAAAQPGGLDVASGGFRDTTRIASGDVTIWQDIFKTNRRAVIDMIDRFTHDLTDLRQRLKAGDDAYLLDQLTRAKTVRDQWSLRQAPARPVRGPSSHEQ